jgi:transposase-like protein
MEPLRKKLVCPECGKEAVVRVMPSGAQHRWHCPNCKKMQTSDQAAVDDAATA